MRGTSLGINLRERTGVTRTPVTPLCGALVCVLCADPIAGRTLLLGTVGTLSRADGEGALEQRIPQTSSNGAGGEQHASKQ